MKRKVFCLLLCSALFVGCSGQTQEPNEIKQTEPAGQKSEKITATTLPYPDLKYNDKILKINDIRLYQSYSEEGYYYTPYLIIRLDKSDLSDEDAHYLFEGDIGQSRFAYLDISPYYSSESNEIQSVRMPQITRYFDGDEIVFAFYDYSQRDAIKNLEDMVVSINIDIIQSDGKLIKMFEDCTKNYYNIEINGESEIKIDVEDDTNIPESENDMLEKGFAKIIQRGF